MSEKFSDEFLETLKCFLCTDYLQLAVDIGFRCNCRKTVCYDCAMKYLELDERRDQRHTKKCFTCRDKITADESCLRPNWLIRDMVDMINKDINDCRKCGQKFKSHSDLLRHKKDQCLFEFCKCPYRGCFATIKRLDLDEHKNKCMYAPRCYGCGMLQSQPRTVEDRAHSLFCVKFGKHQKNYDSHIEWYCGVLVGQFLKASHISDNTLKEAVTRFERIFTDSLAAENLSVKITIDTTQSPSSHPSEE